MAFLKNIIPPNDFKNLCHVYASLFAEVLKRHEEVTEALILLQHADTDDKLMLKGLKIAEVNDFIESKKRLNDVMQEISSLELNQLTQNESIGQLIRHHLLCARKLRHFLTVHPDIVNNFLTKNMFKEGHQRSYALPEMDVLMLLNHLCTSSLAELHYGVKGLKKIKSKIKEELSICKELKSSIDLLKKEYDAMEQQTKSKIGAMDLQIRILQQNFADQKEQFTDSIFEINSKWIEKYEDMIKQSKIRQKHLESVLTLAKERATDEIKAIQMGAREAWSRKYKLESAMESQTASYDEAMTALQEKYDELKKTFNSEKEQMKDYQKKMATLWTEHEEMLTQEEAERERQRAADARDAAVTEACRVINAYARAFLARRAAATTTTSYRRHRESRYAYQPANRTAK